MPKIELTEDQCVSLMDFIELEFIQSLRNDPDADNLQYVINICDIYKAVKEAAVNDQSGN